MVVHAEAVGRAPALSRRERRRVRARHLQGPGDHAARSASPRRGLPHRLLRDGSARGLHLHPRRIHRGAACAAAGGGRSLRGEAHRQGQRPRLSVRPLRPPWRRRVYLRRGDGPPREHGGQEGHAAPEAALPGQYGPLRLPDHGQQRGVDRRGRHDPAPRRRVVRQASAGRTTPAPSSSASPAT